MFRQLRALINVVQTFENWQDFLLDHFGLMKQKFYILRLRNGIAMKIRPKSSDIYIAREIWGENLYNPPGFELKPGCTIIDIGAHIGMFSTYASFMTGGKSSIYSLEPEKNNRSLLRENFAINSVKGVKIMPFGVASKAGAKRIFFQDRANSGKVSLYSVHPYFQSSMARFITFAQLTGKYRIRKIDFLKLDCEGAEYEILFQCPKDLLRRIGRISMECHNFGKGREPAAMRRFLQNEGFDVQSRQWGSDVMFYAKNKMH